MSDDLNKLEDWIEPLIKRLSIKERRGLTRQIATGLRKRQADRIKDQENPDGTPYAARKKSLRTKTGRIKKRSDMFAKLRQARHLLMQSDADSIAIGYRGRNSKIARAHQEGQTEQVAKGGPLYSYPARKLLGYSDDDTTWLLEQLQQHLTK